MNPRKFYNTVIATFSTEIGIHSISFITTIIIVRNLSTTGYGVFTLLMSFSLTLCYLSSIGLPQAIVFFLGRCKEKTDKFVSTYLLILFFILIIVLFMAWFYRDYALNGFLKDLPARYYLPLLILYSLAMFDTFVLSITRGLNNFFLLNLKRFLMPSGNLLVIIFLYFSIGITLKAVIISFAVVNSLFIVWLACKLKSLLSFRFCMDWTVIPSLLKYGSKSYLQSVTGHLIYQIDLYLIAYLLGAREVAYYGIAVGLATILWYIPNTIGIVLFPALSSERNESEIHSFSVQVCKHTLFFTFIAAIGLGLLSEYLLVFLYGPEYIHSLRALLLILPGIILMTIYKVFTRDFSSRNRQQVSIVAAGISLLLNILLNLLWIPEYGIAGAALASTVAYSVAGTILMVSLSVESKIPIRKMLFINTKDIKMYLELFSTLYKRVTTQENHTK